jgi:plasmid stabilization system protein ParE
MDKREIIWFSPARLELLEILEYYFKRNGTMTFSKKLNSNLRNKIRLLANQAEIGVHTDILNIRNLKVGNFSIFYEIKPEIIEVLTIWDNRQNPANLHIKG